MDSVKKKLSDDIHDVLVSDIVTDALDESEATGNMVLTRLYELLDVARIELMTVDRSK